MRSNGSYWSWAVGTGLSTQLDILGRTVKRSIDVGIIYLASSIAFFAAFAFFPLLLAIVFFPPFPSPPVTTELARSILLE